jgi:hypothetical protein
MKVFEFERKMKKENGEMIQTLQNGKLMPYEIN